MTERMGGSQPSGRSVETVSGHEIVLVDSITQIRPEDAGRIVVTGSHGGVSAAGFAGEVAARLYVFNDAGIGKGAAGIKGLHMLDEREIAACAVLHTSAEIGSAADTLACGAVSAVNRVAERLGVRPGLLLRDQLAGILASHGVKD